MVRVEEMFTRAPLVDAYLDLVEVHCFAAEEGSGSADVGSFLESRVVGVGEGCGCAEGSSGNDEGKREVHDVWKLVVLWSVEWLLVLCLLV
jgi:hypothetical protein